jgi:hypothetical protein
VLIIIPRLNVSIHLPNYSLVDIFSYLLSDR